MAFKNKALFAIFISLSGTFASPVYFKAPVLKIDAIWPGIEIEKSVYNTQTLLVNGYWKFMAYGTEGLWHTTTVKTEYRYYYNIDRRLADNNNISKYSGNFLSLAFYYVDWHGTDEKSHYIAGPCWGMQRCFLDHFRWSFNLGIGYETVGYLLMEGVNFDLILSSNIGFSFQI